MQNRLWTTRKAPAGGSLFHKKRQVRVKRLYYTLKSPALGDCFFTDADVHLLPTNLYTHAASN